MIQEEMPLVVVHIFSSASTKILCLALLLLPKIGEKKIIIDYIYIISIVSSHVLLDKHSTPLPPLILIFF